MYKDGSSCYVLIMKKKQASHITDFDVSEQRTVKKVARHFGVPIEDVLGRSRQYEIIMSRLVLAYALRKQHHLSFPAIGKRLGYSHTTAMSAVKRIESMPWIKEQLNEIVA